jgi:hypothetical protein
MSEVRSSGAIARAFALGALVLGPLALAGAAAAQQPFDVTVYHSSSELGEDPRSETCPPGCDCSGGGGGGTTTIHFDGLADGDVVTNQFPEATFSASSFADVIVLDDAASFGTSTPNFICAGWQGEGVDCTLEVIVDFTSPVQNLSFMALGDNASGTTAQVDVFEGQSLSGTVDIVTDGVQSNPHLVDLSSFSNISRIRIYNVTDPAGLGYDDFSFAASGGVDCVIQGGPNEELKAWINGGLTYSGDEQLCMLGEGGGSGHELCGADILFQLTGVGEFERFQPSPGMETLVYKPDCVYDEEAEQCLLPAGTTQIRMNFLSGLDTPGVGPRSLGSLFVNSVGLDENTSTTVTAFGMAAGANLQERPIASSLNPEVVAVSDIPEPGRIVQLVSGLFGLGFLYRLRRRS